MRAKFINEVLRSEDEWANAEIDKREEDSFDRLRHEREEQLKIKPWVLLNSGIPIGFFTEEEKEEVDIQLKQIAENGKNLDHISWKNLTDDT